MTKPNLIRAGLLAGVLAAGAAGAAGTAWAQAASKPDDFIVARKAGYDLLSSVMSDMKRALDNGDDVTHFADSADSMVSWGHAMTGLFPAGTETGHDTKALPAIWSDRAGFEKAAATYTEAAGKLVDVAKSGDKAAFAGAFKTTAQACGACHKAYRARNG